MSRGRPSTVGDTRWSPNGYHYTRTADGWELTHRLIAEKMLGRRLRTNERIRFVDGDRKNLEESNIKVYVTKDKSTARRRAELEAKISDLQAELDALDA